MQEAFRRFSETTAAAVGTPIAFASALLVVVVWAVTGPAFGYSDTWQLVINTGTTIITFLMVFLIQATQNRDTRILNLKLDELLRAVDGARSSFCNLDEFSDEELLGLQQQFKNLGDRLSPLLGDDLAAVERELSSRRSRQEQPAGEKV